MHESLSRLRIGWESRNHERQPVGLGLEGSDGTTHTLASGWKKGCGVSGGLGVWVVGVSCLVGCLGSGAVDAWCPVGLWVSVVGSWIW